MSNAEKTRRELEEIEQRGAGTLIYMSLVETFTRFKLFRTPKRVITISFGALKVFLEEILASVENEERRDELREIIVRSAEKFKSEFSD